MFANPGMTRRGEYDVKVNNGIGTPMFVALNKKATISVGAGVNMGYFFTNMLGVSVGLGYSHQGQNYKDYTIPGTNGGKVTKNSFIKLFKSAC